MHGRAYSFACKLHHKHDLIETIPVTRLFSMSTLQLTDDVIHTLSQFVVSGLCVLELIQYGRGIRFEFSDDRAELSKVRTMTSHILLQGLMGR